MDLKYLCKVIGNLSGVPVRIFQGEKQVFFHSMVALPRDPMALYREDVLRVTGHVGYFVTPRFHYYGVVSAGDTKIVIGPSRQVAESDQALRELGFRADVPPKDMDEFVQGMKSIVCMPLESIMQMLCTINYVLNGEKLELQDVTIHEAEQTSLKEQLERQRSDRAFADNGLQPAHEHNTYTQEQQLLRMVRKGDTASLRAWIASAPAIRGGMLAADQLRQVKNTFVVTATLVSRAAIQGGLSHEDAFTLSDAYIQQCELLTALERIINLQYHMVLEFTERVERLRFGGNPSPLTLAVADYIQRHLSEPIRAERIARELYMSRPYLSARFKKESGETLTDFILREKTEEAKRLLRYSDKSLSAIGAYLGFSSPGHFAQVFRKYARMTPTEYRDRYAR